MLSHLWDEDDGNDELRKKKERERRRERTQRINNNIDASEDKVLHMEQTPSVTELQMRQTTSRLKEGHDANTD